MFRANVLLFVMFAISGCVGSTADQSAALVQLQQACEKGDTDACKAVLEFEQRERERITDIWFGDDILIID